MTNLELIIFTANEYRKDEMLSIRVDLCRDGFAFDILEVNSVNVECLDLTWLGGLRETVAKEQGWSL